MNVFARGTRLLLLWGRQRRTFGYPTPGDMQVIFHNRLDSDSIRAVWEQLPYDGASRLIQRVTRSGLLSHQTQLVARRLYRSILRHRGMIRLGIAANMTRHYEWGSAYVVIGTTHIRCVIDLLSRDLYVPSEYAFMCRYTYAGLLYRRPVCQSGRER